MKDGELVVIDAAAEWGQYTADITRTFPVSGTFTPRQKAIYDLVLATQGAAFDSIVVGVSTMGDLGRVAREYMRAHSGALCGERTCDAYFIHGLGHWIGMDVHDVGITRRRSRRDLHPRPSSPPARRWGASGTVLTAAGPGGCRPRHPAPRRTSSA
jgi:Xaa-Pro aminopeptidase